MRKLTYLKNVVTLALDSQLCIGCKMCVTVCPRAVLVMEDGRAKIDNRDDCMECGACARNCPVEAVSVQAGVGCAEAVINSMLGRKSGSCCCVIEDGDCSTSEQKGGGRSGCC
ncbi:MAG: mercury methylation ferredoxin HgcB [Desulfobulbaceae bacterium]|nr:mercury methylation ferredoxin HgcB [Desulfobulbaceae bacterium]